MATYTRKAFVSVSNILNQFAHEIDKTTFSDLVDEFGDLFANDNPRFDLDKFREACSK